MASKRGYSRNKVLEYLKAHEGDHATMEIVMGSDMRENQVQYGLKKLRAEGLVQDVMGRHGMHEPTRWSLTEAGEAEPDDAG